MRGANQVTEVGIGRALRKARQRLGLSLPEVSRGTRLRTEYLEALEREAFDELPGDAYARGFLRSYASFLGLDPDKVSAVYERARPGEVSGPAAPARPALPGGVHHFPWPLAAGMAVIVIVAAAAAGLFSRSASTPEPAPVAPATDVPVLPPTVTVNVVAQRDVQARVTADRAAEPLFDGVLREGEGRSFEADREIVVWVESGASVRLVVNGRGLGVPGDPTRPYSQAFTPQDFRGSRSENNG